MTLNLLLVAAMWLGISLVLFVNTFIFYLAVMKLRDAQKSGQLESVHGAVLSLGYTILFIGLVFDTLLNWVLLTITFLELPKEFLCTTRIVRLKFRGESWRKTQAFWWCKNWLTPFDILHCERRKRTKPVAVNNRVCTDASELTVAYSKAFK